MDTSVDKTTEIQENPEAVYWGKIDVSSLSDEKQTVISAMEIMREGHLLVCDNANKRIKLLDDDSEILSELPLTSEPRGMVAISASNALISLPSEKSLISFKVKSDHTLVALNKITTKFRCNKLVKYGDDIIAHAYDDNARFLNIMDKEGNVLHCIMKESRGSNGIFGRIRFMALSTDNKILYVTDELQGCVGISMNGEIVFRVKRNGTPNYWGVDTDSVGVLYIACYDTDKVIALRDNGKTVQEVVSKEGLKPCAIFYDDVDQKLYLKKGNSNIVLVFQINQNCN